MLRTTPRIARKPHTCTSNGMYPIGTCTIRPGDRYVELVASPNHGDLGNTGWWRLAECAEHNQFRMGLTRDEVTA